jgi:hypothetical protein
VHPVAHTPHLAVARLRAARRSSMARPSFAFEVTRKAGRDVGLAESGVALPCITLEWRVADSAVAERRALPGGT